MIDEFESRGFAGAAAAQQDQRFSASHFEVQVVEQFASGLAVSIHVIGDIAKLDGWPRVGRIVHREGCRDYPTSYAAGGKPVMRMPEWPLCRMFSPISSAVICSRMRAFSSLPPSMARTPGIFVARLRTTWLALGSSLHTITSQSTGPSAFSSSAPRF